MPPAQMDIFQSHTYKKILAGYISKISKGFMRNSKSRNNGSKYLSVAYPMYSSSNSEHQWQQYSNQDWIVDLER